MSIEKLRIGTGFDVHAFAENRDLILGGVKIPHEKGLAGHSDADALIHAIVDALLGAAGLGDIGRHFPSSDPQWKDAPSTRFLEWTRDRLSAEGMRILSVDSVIITQEPKLAGHIASMQTTLAEGLGLEVSRVQVKATTTDYLGFTGRKEGLAVQASCLVLLA